MIDRDFVLLAVIPFLCGLLSALLGRRSRPLYWAAAATFALSAVGVSLVSSRNSDSSLAKSGLYAGLFLFVPAAAAFGVGRVGALRTRPWAAVVIVAISYVVTVFLVMTLAINLGLSH